RARGREPRAARRLPDRRPRPVPQPRHDRADGARRIPLAALAAAVVLPGARPGRGALRRAAGGLPVTATDVLATLPDGASAQVAGGVFGSPHYGGAPLRAAAARRGAARLPCAAAFEPPMVAAAGRG